MATATMERPATKIEPKKKAFKMIVIFEDGSRWESEQTHVQVDPKGYSCWGEDYDGEMGLAGAASWNPRKSTDANAVEASRIAKEIIFEAL